MISPRRLFVIALLAIGAGCSTLTDVDAPDLVQPTDLDNKNGALARRAGAIAQLASAFGNQVIQSGVLGDEFTDVGDVFPADRRTVTVVNSAYPFATMSAARVSAVRGLAALKQYNPAAPALTGELYALIGFIDVMFVEDLCMPIPIAVVENGVPLAAPPQDRDALIHGALAEFDSAALYSGATEPGRSLAAIGHARADLLQGDLDGAAVAVANVPMSFLYQLPFSASVSTQVNPLFQAVSVNRTLSVADREGQNGLPFVSGSDIRVGALTLGSGRNGRPLVNFLRNSGLGAAIPLASGVEAALIRAEAAWHAGNVTAWAATLNTLRQTAITPALPLLSADSTLSASQQTQVNVLFKERAFWLFGTGHRLGDLRRLVRQYGQSTERVFPTGMYPTQGLTYGTDVMFVPSGEQPNGAYSGCEDRQP